MGYLIFLIAAWLVLLVLGVILRASVPTTVQPARGEFASMFFVTGLAAVAATVLLAGVAALWSAIMGAL